MSGPFQLADSGLRQHVGGAFGVMDSGRWYSITSARVAPIDAMMDVPDRHVRANQISTITNAGQVRFMTYTTTMTAALKV
jgi:hypothetical protein